MSRPLVNLVALLTPLVALTIGAQAQASCTAGRPTANLIESTPTSAFTDHVNGTVTHTLTGLMWKKCAQGLSGVGCADGTVASLVWSGALTAAVADRTAGYDDWRVPNKKELTSIVEWCGYDPSINLTVFPGTPATFSSFFWSSTSYGWDRGSANPTLAWDVFFYDGKDYANPKGSERYVRLVRGGRAFDSFDATDLIDIIFANGFE